MVYFVFADVDRNSLHVLYLSDLRVDVGDLGLGLGVGVDGVGEVLSADG